MKMRFLKSRYTQILMLLIVLATILLVRLFVLTVIQYQGWADTSKNISTRSIYVTAPRGEIYDRHGRLLAGNKQSFTVRMSGSKQEDADLNSNIRGLLDILAKNGDQVVDEFPIIISNNQFYYTYEYDIEKWLQDKDLPTSLNAEEAFNALRGKMGIDPSLNRYDAQLVMQNTYNQFPPISVREMKYLAEIKKKQFLELYFGKDQKSQKLTAEQAFEAIRKKMNIEADLTAEEAREIMVVRNDMKAQGYQQYMPAVVAKGVSVDTVMLIEEEGENLKGVEVVPESTRFYPEGNTASHIVGYLGKITDEEATKNKNLGYENNALIGKEGIEGRFERTLKGENGEKKIQVNAQGQMQKLISETGATKGKDIYLTIDLGLQNKAEEALEKTITAMKSGASINTEFGVTPTAEPAPNAQSGAVIAIEVETGDVLAMASYPDYDPNLFAQGIREENWAALQSANLRDSLSPAPLYNMATMSTVQPGSTFKPITATAALECGLNPNAQYVDDGFIMLGNRKFASALWNLFKQKSGPLNLAAAMEVSCNYYFFDIATGKDWYTGKSLGYTKDITVDTITDYAKQFGLGLPTGIELNEAVVPVPTEARKIEGLKANLGFQLYAGAEDYFVEKVVKNPEQLDKNVQTMKSWIEKDNLTWKELYEDLLPSMGVKDEAKQELGQLILYDLYPQAKWSTADAFNIAIGQGENAYTPLQLANYVATLGNHGIKNQVSVIKAVEEQGNTIKKEASKVKVENEKYFDEVIKGMKRVGSGSKSTVSRIFGNLGFEVAAKTGTAEKSGKVNPPSEVAYMQQHLGTIAPGLPWEEVEAEMNRLMKEYPGTYVNGDTAVRRAIMNLAGVQATQLDAYKAEYDNFAWVVAMAPADNPKIAVCAMVPQGSTAANAAPIVKEVLLKYFQLEGEYKEFKINNVVD